MFRHFYSFLSQCVKIFLLFLGIFLLFISSVRFLGTGDGLATRLLPISLIEDGNFYLDKIIAQDPQLESHYAFVKTDGHFISHYPVLSAFLALPVYVVPYLFKVELNYPLVVMLAKISAAIITTLAALFLYLIFRQFISEKWAIILTLAYALGTSNWTISSQDLWQHGASQLFLILTIFSFLKTAKNHWFSFLGGLFAGLAIAARPLNVVTIFPLLLFVFHIHRRYILNAILGFLPPVILLAIYNTYFFSLPWVTGYSKELGIGFSNPFFSGLAGLLFSPSRGIFVCTPFLLFSLIGMIMVWRWPYGLSKNQKILLRYLFLSALAYIFVMSKWYIWYGGFNYGSRMLTDILPLLVLLLIPVIKGKILDRKFIKITFIIFLLFSIFVQFTGVVVDGESWQVRYDPQNPHDQSWLWDIRHSQFLYYMSKY